MRAIVVGAGFGGIAAALRLRAKGYDVIVLDRCKEIGGRAQIFERDGFRHDAGPTVITAPFLFEELFALFGERLEDHVTLVPLTPWYRFVFSDQTTFDYGGTLAETKAEIDRIEPKDRDGYARLLEHSKRIFDVGFTELSAQPFHRFSTMIRQVPRLVRLRSYETVWQLVCRHLTNSNLRQAFSIQPLLVGGNPFDTTSIYGLIHYLERRYGVFFAMGGTGAITKALSKLMVRQSIDIQLNKTVDRIVIENGVAKGVRLDNGVRLDADVIVSNADAAHLYSSMVKTNEQSISARLKIKNSSYSMGLFVLYFGTKKKYNSVAHHTIWLGRRYKELLNDIFHKRVLADDFSLYVHRPTATDPSFAPAGCDSFYVLCPVPNLKADINWAHEAPLLQDRIVTALDATILPGLRETMTSAFSMTPEDFKENYLSEFGAGFSISPLFTQSAWFRFHNKAEGIENLYLVGAGTHPGGGLPGVLCSAKVLDNLLPNLLEPEIGSETLDTDLTLANNGRSFYWARFFMASDEAVRATRLYSLCRYIDDIADNDGNTGTANSSLLRLKEALVSQKPTNVIENDGIALMKECGISVSVVSNLIDGVSSDIEFSSIADERMLLRYCYQVAGTVGLMMCNVLRVTDPAALCHAVDLGVAMQLTNISRDVLDDAKMGRCYLPVSLVGDLHCKDIIYASVETQAVLARVVAGLLDKADQYYASGMAGLSYLPLRARISILVAAMVYREIGVQLRHTNYAWWKGRTVVSVPKKIFITVLSLASVMFSKQFWMKMDTHNADLHDDFRDYFVSDTGGLSTNED